MLEAAIGGLAYLGFTVWVFSLFYRITLTEDELARELLGENVQRRALLDLIRADGRWLWGKTKSLFSGSWWVRHY